MYVTLSPDSIADYRRFIAIKRLPRYRIRGRQAWFPDEYAQLLGLTASARQFGGYEPSSWLFDYQRDIAKLAIAKRKFAVFADCGLGKTLVFLEFAFHAASQISGKVLILSPLMVVHQTREECRRFYGRDIPYVPARSLQAWLAGDGEQIGISNYDALSDDLRPGTLGCLILDESSMLKSHYGKWGTKCLELGAGLEWKLAGTGTPAPNDRIEYANHAVFLDAFTSINGFLATYFVNRGQTNERWELKPHALGPFYRALSHWSIFLTNPATYGWRDNCGNIPPVNINIHDVDLTPEQERIGYSHTGTLFATQIGGITNRAALGGLAKGQWRGKRVESHKPAYIRRLVESWPDESTIVWCLYNHEQDLIAEQFPDAADIRGATALKTRLELLTDFQAGRRRVLISKPKVLGFGLNLQIATRQVFSGLQDSYEQFYQAVKRSNRYGSTRPLNVHIPVTDLERPMIETVLRKAKRVQADAEEQERLFKRHSIPAMEGL